MIVRIANEGQYRLDDAHHARLDELDDEVVAAVDAGDEDRYHETFEELPEDDLEPSEFILPPADTTFVEARDAGHFEGEGLIPDPDPTPDAA